MIMFLILTRNVNSVKIENLQVYCKLYLTLGYIFKTFYSEMHDIKKKKK